MAEAKADVIAEVYAALEPISHGIGNGRSKLYQRGQLVEGLDAEETRALLAIKAIGKLSEALAPSEIERALAEKASAEAEVVRLRAELASLQAAARDGIGGGAAIELADQAERDLAAAEVAASRSDVQSAAAESAVKAAPAKSAGK